MAALRYTTPGGINVTRLTSAIPFKKGLGHLLNKLDRYRGIYLSSGYEYPERYSRWDIASICPPIEIVAAGPEIEFRPLNARGEVLNQMLHRRCWKAIRIGKRSAFEGAALRGRLKPLPALFPEEERSKQPSAFSILRALIDEFRSEQDSRLALVGAFGYDLLFQFDPIELKLPRHGHKDLHSFSVRRHLLHGSQEGTDRALSVRLSSCGDLSTAGLARTGGSRAAARQRGPTPKSTPTITPEEYMAKVETVREGMRQGDYYEVVLRQTFQRHYSGRALRAVPAHAEAPAPAPTNFCCNWATSN